MDVPIDEEIADLVEELMVLPGVTLTSSCAAHSDRDNATITFLCTDIDSLKHIIKAAPLAGFRCTNEQGHLVDWLDISIAVSLHNGSGDLQYTLYFYSSKLSTIRDRTSHMVEELKKQKRESE